MQAHHPALQTLVFSLALASLLAVTLFYGRPYLTPIAVAVLIWFLINALAEALRQRAPRLPDWAAYAAAVAVLFGAVLFVGRVITENASALSAGLSGVETRLIDAANQLLERLGLEHRVEMEAVMQGLRFEDLAREVFDAARGFASDVVLVFLYVMFLLVDQRFYVAKLEAIAPDARKRAGLRATLRHMADEVRAYLWLMTLISAGVGVTTWAICAVAGVSGAGFWGFLAFGLNFIPTIGSILAVAFPALYALLQFDDPSRLLALVPALAALQFVAGEIVLPRVMGDRLNLSSFVILLSLVLWGAVWGPVGMFLAVPIMVIVMIVLAQFPSTRPIAIGLSRSGVVGSALHERDGEGRTDAKGRADAEAGRGRASQTP